MLVQLDGIRLNYQVFGEGRPILILHGFFGISDGMIEVFEPIFEKIEGFQRIYLDSPGNGASGAPDWIQSSDQILDVVEQFIDKVIPDEQFLSVGYSYGGYLTLGLVHRRPAQIDGIMLLCPLVEPDEFKRQIPSLELRKVDTGFFENLDIEFQKVLLSGQFGMVVVQPEVFTRAEKVYTPGHQAANADFLNRIKEKGYGFSFDINQVSFEKPALILTGRQDNSVGYQDAIQMINRFKRTSFAFLDAAGHSLPLEQRQVFESMVREWLERVDNYDHDSSLPPA